MRALTVLPLIAALSLPSAAWSASDRDEVLDTLPERAWAASITSLDPSITQLEPRITDFDPSITPMDSRTTDGQEEVISLASDVLFAFDKADISSAAEAKIRQLVADVPDGANVKVHGHTDSWGTQERNAELSVERAEAVAAVIEQDRPDLSLQVEGFGPDEPVEPNEIDGEDNPEGRALNRRVEIRYED
ncbi:OmpA family protein [Ornithinimicrobium sp. Y1847]|uniref:OmpA family protein n=1 Tax=Ornithinimicrobium sp. Y1847 TaxID=3405419 RepID=UPI003B66FC30